VSWARFDDNMATHPKCAPLSDFAFRLMVHANLWARAQKTEGFVPRDMLPTILPGRSRASLAAAVEELVRAGGMLHPQGLWEPGEGGWRIHDFDRYGHQNPVETRVAGDPSRGAVDADLSRKRAEAGRRGGQVSGAVRSRTAVPGAPLLPPSVPVEPAFGAATKQIARPMEPNRAKQDASPGEAIKIPILDPDPIPDPNHNPDMIPVPDRQANEQKWKQESGSNFDASFGADSKRRSDQSTPIGDRAKSHLRNSRAAEAISGSPLDWPELQTIWRAFESTWGKPDRPREAKDPRVQVVLERFASGRTPDELVRAIRASKQYAPVVENPSYRRIKTILKDEEQVDNLLRLADAPPSRNGRLAQKQQGGWTAPMTERLDHA
jgi:hypothetical protein